MPLIPCPACSHQVSDRAFACPSCGHPIAGGEGRASAVRMLGGVAGTYISANAVVQLVLGVVFCLCVAAVIMTLIIVNR